MAPPGTGRVVVIEADATVRDVAVARLEAAGFTVQAVESPSAGFGVLQAGPAPDAAVLDCFVPGLPPDALIRTIRSWHPEVVLVLWSDVLTEVTYATLLAAGATASVPRADVAIELAPLVQRMLAMREERRQGGARPAADPNEERENTRHRLCMPVAVRAEGWDEYAICYTNDVSRGGLFVRLTPPPPIGERLTVRVGLPDGTVMELQAEVAHVVPPEQVPPGRRAGCGLRFIKRRAEDRSALAAMVATLREVSVPSPLPPPPPPPLATEPDAISQDAAELQAALAELRRKDFFTMLGLAPGVEAGAARQAFLEVARRWHPSRYALAVPAVRAVTTDIFLLIRQAHDTLVDPESAAAYAQRLPRPRARRPAAGRPPAPQGSRPPATAAADAPAAAADGPPPPTGATPPAPAATTPPPAAAGRHPDAVTGDRRSEAAIRRPDAERRAAPARQIGRLEGVLHNPQTLAELARLPLQPNAALDDAALSSLVCLLRWLARNRASGLLTLQAPRPVVVPLARGRIHLGERETTAVVQSAVTAEVPYVFEPRSEADVPTSGKAHAGWAFSLYLVRMTVHQAPLEDLRAQLPADQAPVVRPEGTEVIAGLNPTGAERRFMERLTGAEPVAQLIANAGISSLAAARLLFALNVLGALDWQEPSGGAADEDPVKAAFARMAVGNLFDQVGGHYSTPPPRLRAAYEALLADYGPGSENHARSPEYAAMIVARARRAWEVIHSRTSRRSYRTDVLRIDLRSAANVLMQEAKMALMRNQDADAREALAAAYDLDPRPEVMSMWRNLGSNPDGGFAPDHADRTTLEEIPAAKPRRSGPPTR